MYNTNATPTNGEVNCPERRQKQRTKPSFVKIRKSKPEARSRQPRTKPRTLHARKPRTAHAQNRDSTPSKETWRNAATSEAIKPEPSGESSVPNVCSNVPEQKGERHRRRKPRRHPSPPTLCEENVVVAKPAQAEKQKNGRIDSYGMRGNMVYASSGEKGNTAESRHTETTCAKRRRLRNQQTVMADAMRTARKWDSQENIRKNVHRCHGCTPAYLQMVQRV